MQLNTNTNMIDTNRSRVGTLAPTVTTAAATATLDVAQKQKQQQQRDQEGRIDLNTYRAEDYDTGGGDVFSSSSSEFVAASVAKAVDLNLNSYLVKSRATTTTVTPHLFPFILLLFTPCFSS